MNFLKPSYMLELEIDASAAPLTDAQAVFRAHSTTLWNFTNTIAETADKKQAQAYWCRVNKKKLVAGLSNLDAASGTAKRFLVNKKPKAAISGHYMHFVYITGGIKPPRLFCLWQFIDEEALTAGAAVVSGWKDMLELAEAEKADALEAAEIEKSVLAEAVEKAEAEKAVLAAALKKSEATISTLKEQLEKADAALSAAEPVPKPAEEAPINIIAGALVQIESRLSALEGANSCALQLGMILGLSSASASAEAPPAEEASEEEEAESAGEESASDADADADPLVIDTKKITDPLGANPVVVGDIIIGYSKGVKYFVEVKTVNNAGFTFKLLKHLGGNIFRYSKRTPPAKGNFNYDRRLYRVTNGQLQGA